MLTGWIVKMIPLLTVLMLVLVSVIPLGFGEVVSFALPVLPFAAIHYWMVSGGRSISMIAVFLVGIFVDVLTYGPLGYWSLLYLTGVSVTAGLEMLLQPERRLWLWVTFMAANGAVCFCAWGVAAIYFGGAVESWPMTATAIVLGCSYPILAAALSAIDRWSTPPRQLNLERRA